MMRMRTIVAAMAAAMLAGCSAGADAPADQPDLRLEFDASNAGMLGLSIRFQGAASGVSVLDLDTDFGFTYPEADWFSGFEAVCQQPCEAVFDPQTLSVRITHVPSDSVSLSYQLHQGAGALSDVDNYEPIVSPEGVVFYTGISVFMPTHIVHEEATSLTLSTRWTGVDAQGWQAFSPFGPGEDERSGPLTQMRLRESLFAAAPGGVIHTLEDGAQLGALPMPGTSQEPAALLDLIEPALIETRAMFEGAAEAGDWYFIAYGAAGEVVENGFALGGTAITNAFALYFSPGLSLGPDGAWLHPSLQDIVAHEYFHNWNGVLFYLADGDDAHSTRWFVEGFTNYYAREMAWRSGLYDDAKYVETLNTAITAYQDAEHRDLTHDEMAELWAVNDERAAMSYTRGELIALMLNEALRSRSDGALGLDDLMRDLAREARTEGVERPDVSRFYAWIADHADPSLADEIRAYAEAGRPLELPARVQAPALIWDQASGQYRRDEAR
jgi:hypothetical protein